MQVLQVWLAFEMRHLVVRSAPQLLAFNRLPVY